MWSYLSIYLFFKREKHKNEEKKLKKRKTGNPRIGSISPHVAKRRTVDKTPFFKKSVDGKNMKNSMVARTYVFLSVHDVKSTDFCGNAPGGAPPVVLEVCHDN